MQGVRRVTSELGIPLIVDEIQTGCGRTGTWFAFEQHGIVPDVVLASKALGGIGMPIAVVFYDKRLDVWAPGAHTATFRGNQLAFAAGVAAARIIQRDGVLENVRKQGAYVIERLLELEGPVRLHRRGARCRSDDRDARSSTRRPARPTPSSRCAIQRGALERGLILELGGRGRLRRPAAAAAQRHAGDA